jgi:hypothetical protein
MTTEQSTAPAPVTKPAAPTPTPAAPSSDAIVDKWVCTFIYGSIVSRETDVFNYLATVAVPELKRLLAGEKQS